MSLYKFTRFVKNDAQLKQKKKQKGDKQPKKSQNKAKKKNMSNVYLNKNK